MQRPPFTLSEYRSTTASFIINVALLILLPVNGTLKIDREAELRLGSGK